MNFYKTIFQIIAILFLVFLFFLFLRYIRMKKRKKRITSFTIKKEEKSFSFYPLIEKISCFLEQLVFLNSLALHYERYVYKEGFLRKGMDLISIKILGGTFLSLLYLFYSAIYQKNFLLEIFFVLFLLGAILTHLYFFLTFKKNTNVLFSSIADAVFILNSNLKTGISAEQSIKNTIKKSEGVVKLEFQKVYKDLEIGFTLGDAFYRFYQRTSILFLKEISVIFKLLENENVSKIKVFETIFEMSIEETKKREAYKKIRNRNYLACLFFSLLPLIFCFLILISKEDFYILIFSKYRWIFLLIEGTLYLFYLFLMNYLARRRYR